jgi:hypothetical protein
MASQTAPSPTPFRAFAHYPANTFPGQGQPLRDDTHPNACGGYELARCVVEGIRANVPALAAQLGWPRRVVAVGIGKQRTAPAARPKG